MEVINETRTKIIENEELLKKYTYYSEMFGFQDAVETSHNTLKNVNTYIDVIQKLWQQIQSVGSQLDKFKTTYWKDVNTNQMEDTIKKAKKALTSNIKGQVRKTDAYLDYFKYLKTWTTFTELIIELSDENMTVDDDRHWQAVRKLLNKDFTITSNSKLKMLWDMDIPQHDEAIKDIGE